MGPGEWARHDPHRCASGRQPRCNCVDASGCSGSIDSFAHPITSLYTIRASAPWRTTWITSGSRMMRCCLTARAVSHLDLHT